VLLLGSIHFVAQFAIEPFCQWAYPLKRALAFLMIYTFIPDRKPRPSGEVSDMRAKDAFRVLGAGLILLGFGASGATVSAAIGSTYIPSISLPSGSIEQPVARESASVQWQVAQRAQRAAPFAAAPPGGRAGPRRMGPPNSRLGSRPSSTPVSFGCPPPAFLDPDGPPFGPPAHFPPPFRPCPVSP